MKNLRSTSAKIALASLAVIAAGGAGTVLAASGLHGKKSGSHHPAVRRHGSALRGHVSVAETANVEEVPSTVSGTGVNVNNQVVLTPVTSNSGYMTATDAVTRARGYVDAQQFAATSLLANVTLPASVPPSGSPVPFTTVQDVPAWIVTFTSPQPVNVAQGGDFPAGGSPQIFVTHFSIALDATSGRFLLGFFTK